MASTTTTDATAAAADEDFWTVPVADIITKASSTEEAQEEEEEGTETIMTTTTSITKTATGAAVVVMMEQKGEGGEKVAFQKMDVDDSPFPASSSSDGTPSPTPTTTTAVTSSASTYNNEDTEVEITEEDLPKIPSGTGGGDDVVVGEKPQQQEQQETMLSPRKRSKRRKDKMLRRYQKTLAQKEKLAQLQQQQQKQQTLKAAEEETVGDAVPQKEEEPKVVGGGVVGTITQDSHSNTNNNNNTGIDNEVGSTVSSSCDSTEGRDMPSQIDTDDDDEVDVIDDLASINSNSMVSSSSARKKHSVEERGGSTVICFRRFFYFIVLIAAVFICTVVFLTLPYEEHTMEQDVEDGEDGDDNSTFQNTTAVSVMALVMFVVIILTFCAYDYLVGERQKQLVRKARKQEKLMTSMFPKNIHNILMDGDETTNGRRYRSGSRANAFSKASLKSLMKDRMTSSSHQSSRLDELEEGGRRSSSASFTSGLGGVEDDEDEEHDQQPIADLFPECTILFADIAGFTAWSSAREPAHVFKLLETIYSAFDRIAKKKGVYKVETVGDCYVAVCGLPEPRKDHAVAMGRFARSMIEAFNIKMKELELKLGPDTTNLALRAGLHSGPVVAGVLRTQNSRFQLFGDTMNCASRMESTGLPNHIQVSQETANLLTEAGKDYWLTPREEKVEAKGKGKLQTYFLSINRNKSDVSCASSVVSSVMDATELDADKIDKRNRSAEWLVEVLSSILKEISSFRSTRPVNEEQITSQREFELYSMSANRDAIDEVAPVIILPEYDGGYSDTTGMTLDPKVHKELRSFVHTIAKQYNDNPFHCFDHASHVTLSCAKLLSRVTAPDLGLDADDQDIHHESFGITNDPLTKFAIILAALIHDVDHSGVSNDTLVKENDPLAIRYKNMSVAEQNSFDLSWNLLMEPSYDNLRRAIYHSEREFKRFRQLLINSVMATDIVNKDLKERRNRRWEHAFADDESPYEQMGNDNLKATIVIEHIIMASDVAHTMQHWTIFRRWNERLFNELCDAYEAGRIENNPVDGWYKGEIGFFDFYIIPLAKKLKDCGVFGSSSDEYLSYAKLNRAEWEQRGEEIVAEMVSRREKAKRNAATSVVG